MFGLSVGDDDVLDHPTRPDCKPAQAITYPEQAKAQLTLVIAIRPPCK